MYGTAFNIQINISEHGHAMVKRVICSSLIDLHAQSLLPFLGSLDLKNKSRKVTAETLILVIKVA